MKCTTHHYACACIEEKRKQEILKLKKLIKSLRKKIKDMKAEWD